MSGGDFVLLALLLAIYFLPWIVAAQRNHRNAGAICALNLFLGWTVLGWVAALVWSLTADTEEQPSAQGRIKIEKDQPEDVFRPDGMVGNTPYRVLPNGEAEALTQGGIVRFRNLDHLRSMMSTTPLPQTEKRDVDPKPEINTQNTVIHPTFGNLPEGTKAIAHKKREIAFLPDGTVIGETNSGPRKFDSFEDWRRFTGE